MIVKANHQCLGNDLYWTIYHNGNRICWTGYDDKPWWDIYSEQTRTQIVNGYEYTIDYYTHEVKIEPVKES